MKSTLTLIAATTLFGLGIFFGFQLLTQPSESSARDQPTCEDRSFSAGDKISANQIRVSVLNAGERAGMATEVSIGLQRRGFTPGVIANAPDQEASNVTILTTDPKHPAVVLLAKQFKGKVAYGEPINDRDDVTILIGDDFAGLAEDAPTDIAIEADTTWCVPILSPL